MSLLQQKSAPNPVLPDLQSATDAIFEDLEKRMLAALGGK